MVDFAKLKSMSGKKSIESLSASLSKLSGNQENKGGKDDRFWTATVDKAGNGYAVIRFLPAPGSEEDPFVRVFDHGFQGPGGWYIENSLSTIGQPDPVGEHNSKLWNTGTEANKEIVRKQKRRLHYISNIYVVSDQGNPENEGKVFLFKYGKKIFDKLNEAMFPEFKDETPINPFDLWDGANFKLKIRNVEGYRNYDKSEFDKSKPLMNDDDELQTIWKKEYSLKEFLEPKNFKSYEELKARLTKVLGDTSFEGKIQRAEEKEIPWDVSDDVKPKFKSAEPKRQVAASADDDDELDYFTKLAKSDD